MPRTAVTGPYRQPVNNLVYNGDFEYAPVVNVATTSTGVWIDGTAGGAANNNNFGWANEVVTGTASSQITGGVLKLSTLAVASRIVAALHKTGSGKTLPNNLIPVIPNTSYTLTYRMKTNLVSGSSVEGANVYFLQRDGNGNYIQLTSNSIAILTTTDWTTYSFSVTVSGTCRFINICPNIQGTTGAATLIMDAYFDEIELRPTTAVTRTQITGPYRQPVDNMVRNGDFEYAPAFTAATNAAGKWIDGTALGNVNTSPIYTWGTLTAGANAVAQFDSARKYTGSNSLKASITIAGANTISVATSKSTSLLDVKKTGIPVLPSTSYTLSGYMKTSAISGTATTGAQLIASERNADGTQAVANPTVGVPTTTDWTRYSVTFTTSATTKYIMVKCNIQSDGAATLIMDAWFDNIKLDLTSGTSRTVVV